MCSRYRWGIRTRAHCPKMDFLLVGARKILGTRRKRHFSKKRVPRNDREKHDFRGDHRRPRLFSGEYRRGLVLGQRRLWTTGPRRRFRGIAARVVIADADIFVEYASTPASIRTRATFQNFCFNARAIPCCKVLCVSMPRRSTSSVTRVWATPGLIPVRMTSVPRSRAA